MGPSGALEKKRFMERHGWMRARKRCRLRLVSDDEVQDVSSSDESPFVPLSPPSSAASDASSSNICHLATPSLPQLHASECTAGPDSCVIPLDVSPVFAAASPPPGARACSTLCAGAGALQQEPNTETPKQRHRRSLSGEGLPPGASSVHRPNSAGCASAVSLSGCRAASAERSAGQDLSRFETFSDLEALTPGSAVALGSSVRLRHTVKGAPCDGSGKSLRVGDSARKGGRKTLASGGGARATCAICLVDLSDDEPIGKLDVCSHIFCFDCILRWAAVSNRCPLCKIRFHRIAKTVRRGTEDGGEEETEIEGIEVNDKDPQDDGTAQGALDEYICQVCGSGRDEDVLLLCDLCDDAYHTYCVALDRVPEGEWYCPECVLPGPNSGRSLGREMMVHVIQFYESALAHDAPREPQSVRGMTDRPRGSGRWGGFARFASSRQNYNESSLPPRSRTQYPSRRTMRSRGSAAQMGVGREMEVQQESVSRSPRRRPRCGRRINGAAAVMESSSSSSRETDSGSEGPPPTPRVSTRRRLRLVAANEMQSRAENNLSLADRVQRRRARAAPEEATTTGAKPNTHGCTTSLRLQDTPCQAAPQGPLGFQPGQTEAPDGTDTPEDSMRSHSTALRPVTRPRITRLRRRAAAQPSDGIVPQDFECCASSTAVLASGDETSSSSNTPCVAAQIQQFAYPAERDQGDPGADRLQARLSKGLRERNARSFRRNRSRETLEKVADDPAVASGPALLGSSMTSRSIQVSTGEFSARRRRKRSAEPWLDAARERCRRW